MSYFVPILNFFAPSSKSTKPTDDDSDPICKFQNPSDPNMVIIFFHDILWEGGEQQLHKSTWMSSSTPPICWPETWLSEKYPKAQILSAHYDAAISEGKTAGHMDLFQLSENLWQDIFPIYTTEVPVFLVGHGLGGLVIKALIVKMEEERHKQESRKDKDWCKLKSFLNNVKGILYYSTPFLGSELADIMRSRPSPSLLADDLAVLSTNMCRLNDRFRNWRKDHQDCHARVLCEGLPTKVGFWDGYVVKESSARDDADRFYTVNSNHFDVCKPRSVKDNRFTVLIEIIEYSITSTLKSFSTVPIEDNARRTCAEYVKKMLKQIQEVQRVDRGVLPLSKDELTKIRNFEDLWGNLQDSLAEAGLQRTSDCADFEFYE